MATFQETQVLEQLQARDIVVVSVADLVRDNPQMGVINEPVLDDMRGPAFDENRFEAVPTARVLITRGKKRIFITGLVDGNTRLQHAQEGGWESIPTIDATESLLRSERIVHEGEERVEGALTMVQYLRAVVDPTKAHEEIAPRRIVVHLINGWKQMVGEGLAAEFSAVAALSLLADPNVPHTDEELLSQYLVNQEALMAGETHEKRHVLEVAIKQMSLILLNTNVDPFEAHKEAFLLLGRQDATIGGSDEALREFYGLLSSRAVAGKLSQACGGNPVYLQQLREQMAQIGIASLSRMLVSFPNRGTGVIVNIIKDRSLTYEQTVDILALDDPYLAYRTILIQIREKKIVSRYLADQGKSPSDKAKSLISLLAKTHIDEREIPQVAKIVQIAEDASTRAQRLIVEVDTKSKWASRDAKMQATVASLRPGISAVWAASSPVTLRMRVRELNELCNSIEGIKSTPTVSLEKLGEQFAIGTLAQRGEVFSAVEKSNSRLRALAWHFEQDLKGLGLSKNTLDPSLRKIVMALVNRLMNLLPDDYNYKS